MKQILLLALTLVLTSHAIIQAQQLKKGFYKTSYESRNNGTFDKGTGILTFGLGVPRYAWSGFPLGPAYIKYEHGLIRDEIGLGGHIAGTYYHDDYRLNNSVYKHNTTAVSFAIMGFYHFNKLIPVTMLDVYIGSGFGMSFFHHNYDDNLNYYNDNTDVVPFFTTKVGVRYYLNDSFGVYAEAGYDNMSSANLGISIRF